MTTVLCKIHLVIQKLIAFFKIIFLKQMNKGNTLKKKKAKKLVNHPKTMKGKCTLCYTDQS